MIPPPGRRVSRHEMADEIAGVCAARQSLLVEVDCDAGADPTVDLSTLLTPGEVAAFGRLQKPMARSRAVVRRAALRAALGAGLRLPPRQVPLWYDESGRPRVGVPGQGDLFGLSCSSCEGLAVFCLAPCVDVGVDVQACSERMFPMQLASHMLHEEENRLFESIPDTSQTAWLTGAWVCKEAWLKAHGSGLLMDPRDLCLQAEGAGDFRRNLSFGLSGTSGQRGFLRWDGEVALALVLSSAAPGLRRVRWNPEGE